MKTGLEWVVGPDRDTNYEQAKQWVAACRLAGGGWRMPKLGELSTLYQEGVGERNMDTAFKTTGWLDSIIMLLCEHEHKSGRLLLNDASSRILEI